MTDKGRGVESICHEARQIGNPAERDAYLAKVCAGDDSMRARVEKLIAAEAELGSPMPNSDETLKVPSSARSGTPSAETTVTTPLSEKPGAVIGRYKLLQQIGEGGFGSVWMAEQREPVRRRVALKVIKLGMDTKQVIARFEAERQALAMMDHPNIAKVLDAGSTETGRAYFVMELVRGVPITEYCDTNRLSTRDRLGLFIPICNAIQHAHQKGVIHRDVKPSNVLVTMHDGIPIPKVIDFGIAKATDHRLTEHTLFTEFHQLIGTPDYMSPEQAEMSGLDIDTRTDIYSLGVLLYELIAGVLPFDRNELRSGGYDAMKKRIREEEPQKPSTRVSTVADSVTIATNHGKTDPGTLKKQLRGDLDWITMKAMEKDRTRRYDTANGLAMEIKRYLNNEPVLAGQPSTTYRFAKFVRRNKAAVIGAALITAALVVGIVGATSGMVWAIKAQKKATASAIAADQARAAEKRQREEADAARFAADRAREEAEIRGYTTALNAAAADLERNDAISVRRQLEQTPERLRGWEWNYLWNESDRSLSTPIKLPRRAKGYFMSLSPDGTRLAVRPYGGNSAPVQVFNTRSGTLITTLATWSGSDASMTFSHDNRYLAVRTRGFQTLDIFDVVTGKRLFTDKRPVAAIQFLGFDPAGTFAAVALQYRGETKTPVRLYRLDDMANYTTLLEDVDWAEMPRCAAISPDGKLLGIGFSGTDPVHVYSVSNGEIIAKIPETQSTTSLHFNNEGTRVATLVAATGRIRVIDTAEWKEVVRIELGGSWLGDTSFASTSESGPQSLITTGRDGAVRVFNAQTGAMRAILHGHGIGAESIQIDKGENQIVTAHIDGVVRRWDRLRPGGLLASTSMPRIAFALDSTMLLMGGHAPRQVGCADLQNGAVLGHLRCFPVSVAHSSVTSAMAKSPEGGRLAVATRTGWGQGRLKVFDVDTQFSKFDSGVFFDEDLFAVAWNWDGRLIATAGQLGNIRLFDGQSYARRGNISAHEDRINELTFSREPEWLLSASEDGTIGVWDAGRNERVRTLGDLGGAAINRIVLLPDRAELAAGAADGTITIWNYAAGEPIVRLDAHGGEVSALAVFPDGSRLVSGSTDRSVRIWDTGNWRELVTLRFKSGISDLAFSPDGSRLIIAQADRNVDSLDCTAESVRAEERRAHRDARSIIAPLVNEWFERNHDSMAVRRLIEADASMSEGQRKAALRELKILADKPFAAAYDKKHAEDIAEPHVRDYVLRNLIVTDTDNEEWLNFEPVAKKIRGLPGLSEEDRQAAAEYASAMRFWHHSSAKGLGTGTDILATRVIIDPGNSREEYAIALFAMEACNEEAPQNGGFLATLGGAQYRIGLFNDSVSTLNRSLDLTRGQANMETSHVFTWIILAMAKHRLGLGDEAVAALTRADELLKKESLAKNAMLTTLRKECANLLATPSGAITQPPVTRESLETLREKLDVGNPKDHVSMRMLAERDMKHGRPADAEKRFLQAIALAREEMGDDDISVTGRMVDLSRAQLSLGKFAEAERTSREALSRTRQALGDDHISVTWRMVDLGRAQLPLGKFVEAERTRREALSRTRQALGENNIQVAYRMKELAGALEAQSKPTEAETFRRDALTLTRRLLTDEHRQTMWRTQELGQNLLRQKKIDEAEKLCRDGLAIARKIRGPEHRDVAGALVRLGLVVKERGDVAGAETHYRDALAIQRRTLSEGDASIGSTLILLGQTLIAQEKFVEAESMLRECLEIRRKALPGDHWLLPNTASTLGETIAEQGRFSEAESLLLDSFATLESRADAIPGGYRDVRLREAIQRIVKLYEAWHAAEPGKGYDAKGAEWKAKLDAAAP